MKKATLIAILGLVALLGIGGYSVHAQQGLSVLSNVSGERSADAYDSWRAFAYSGNSTTGSTSITVSQSGGVTLNDGSVIFPFNINAPLIVDFGQVNAEVVTPTTVSGCSSFNTTEPPSCTITATFANTHGRGATIKSATAGLQEAINAAFAQGGGQVTMSRLTVNNATSIATLIGAPATFQALMLGLVPYQNVGIVDKSFGATQYWNTTPVTTTVLATPATLISTTVASNIGLAAGVAGSASWGSTTYACITYVDVMGQESPCSATYNFTSTTLLAIGFTAPAASTGAVGWKPYLSVSGGTYALAYSLPLITQAGASTGVCTMTKIETTTPACALTNTTYGQTGVGAVFTSYPVVTSQLAPEAASASAATYNGNNSGHTVFSFVPGSHVGIPGVVASNLPYPITTAMQTTVPAVAGSIYLPPNFMNGVGRSIKVCGLLYKTSTTADTVTKVQLWWDAEGSNVSAGTPVQLTNTQVTNTLAAAANYQFCQVITTTVAATTATGGTIIPGQGWLTEAQVAAGAAPVGGPTDLVAAVASLNLALNSRLDVVYNHTTGTDGTGVILQGATVEVIN